MAITYPLSLPSAVDITGVRFTPRTRVAVSRSPFTHQAQVHVHQGQWFEAQVDVARGTRTDLERWVAFLLALNGQEGTFLMGDPVGAVPRGAAKDTPGTPLVAGAGQTGQDIDFDGAPASVTGYLLEGDWVQFGAASSARLHKVLADSNTDAGGAFTLTLWPRVRTAPADNAALTVSNAAGLWRLASNEMSYDIEQAAIFGLDFTAVSEV